MSIHPSRWLFLALSLGAGLAQAAPTTYFAQTAFGGGVTAQVLAAQTQFRGALNGSVSTYGFEDKAVGAQSPQSVTFTGSASKSITATLTGDGVVQTTLADTGGRYNTTTGGSNFWLTNAGAASPMTLTFGAADPVAGFGFYLTDAGDFSSQLFLDLTPTDGSATVSLQVPFTSTANGNILFFGFTDKNQTYSKVVFRSTSQSVVDGYGFDDFVLVDAGQVNGFQCTPGVNCPVPEPGSLALVGLALGAAGWVSRAKRPA